MSKRTPQRTLNSCVSGPSSPSVKSELTVDEKLQRGWAQARIHVEERIDERFGTFQDMIRDEFVNAFAKQEEEMCSRFDPKLEALGSRIDILTTRMREDYRTRFNILSSRPHQEIRFPARIDDNGSHSFPIRSPRTVGDFCRLRRRGKGARRWVTVVRADAVHSTPPGLPHCLLRDQGLPGLGSIRSGITP